MGNKQTETSDENMPNLNKFSSVGSSVVKVIFMSAGEFDLINVNFSTNAMSIYVFVGFLFLISTVFMNLLNGLAVSDTHQIQCKAELTSFWRRCQVISKYEEVLSNKNHWFRYGEIHFISQLNILFAIFLMEFSELDIAITGKYANCSHNSTRLCTRINGFTSS